MKMQRVQAAFIAAVFAASFLMPAFDTDTGFECVGFCFGVLIDSPDSNNWGQAFYYGGFVLTNVLFVLWNALLLTRKRFAWWHAILITLLSLHVLSWWVLGRSEVGSIKIGYFVWLFAYLALTARIFKSVFAANACSTTGDARPASSTSPATAP